MEGETEERWRELCEQAAKEQDSRKLLLLIEEINLLLGQKKNRLRHQSQEPASSA